LAELERRRTGLLLIGYVLNSRGMTHWDLFSLFVQLVVDAIRVLKKTGCLSPPRAVRVLKEAESGIDTMYLERMQRQLSDLIAVEFPGQVFVHPIESVVKGREVLLECADLIAGGVQRRVLYKGRNPKDYVAEAVINVTGFESPADNGALFKVFPS
jgi:hypothetical protein